VQRPLAHPGEPFAVVHTVVHEPQFETLVCRSTHALPPQSISDPVQPDEHAKVPPAAAEQTGSAVVQTL
jgi:hypothetical protein